MIFTGHGFLNAQPRKGSILVSPSYGLTGKKIETNGVDTEKTEKKDELLSFGFTPRIGYQFSQKVAAGISFKYGRKILEDDNGKLNLVTTGPFARYYLLSRKISPYLEAEAGMGKYTESESGISTFNSYLFYLSGGGGTEFFISPSFSFDFGFNFKKTSENPEFPAGQNRIVSGNLGFRAGLSLHLNSKGRSKNNNKPGKSWL